ncbi:hypothetical protein M3J09_013881 [Ascochyta lentis]
MMCRVRAWSRAYCVFGELIYRGRQEFGDVGASPGPDGTCSPSIRPAARAESLAATRATRDERRYGHMNEASQPLDGDTRVFGEVGRNNRQDGVALVHGA